jgi:bacterioferritin
VKGHDQIIAVLNDVLTSELTAINQYFIHARMCENWGYERLWKKVREESIGEMKHADRLIERILYLEGVPNLQKLGKVNVGETVPEQLKLDLAVEAAAIKALNAGIALSVQLGDNGTRDLLEEILTAEEQHPADADQTGGRGELPRAADQGGMIQLQRVRPVAGHREVAVR